MHDAAIRLENRPGALVEMGAALGRARLSVEGGGFVIGDAADIVGAVRGRMPTSGATRETVLLGMPENC